MRMSDVNALTPDDARAAQRAGASFARALATAHTAEFAAALADQEHAVEHAAFVSGECVGRGAGDAAQEVNGTGATASRRRNRDCITVFPFTRASRPNALRLFPRPLRLSLPAHSNRRPHRHRGGHAPSSACKAAMTARA